MTEGPEWVAEKSGPTVSVGLDLTVPHPNIQFLMFKPSIRIDGLDPATPADELERIVQGALDLSMRTIVSIDDGMHNVVQRLISPEAPIPGVRGQIAEARDLALENRSQIRRIVEQLREYDIAGLVRTVRGAGPVAEEQAKGVPMRDDGSIVGMDGVGIADDAPEDVTPPRARPTARGGKA